jgi:hypothetical protein
MVALFSWAVEGLSLITATAFQCLTRALELSAHRSLTIYASTTFRKLAKISEFRSIMPEATKHPKIFLEPISLVCASSKPSTIRKRSGAKVSLLSLISAEGSVV